jgi:two-component system, cell cycle response regulator DivK
MGARILLVEDNEQNIYLMNFLLESHGHEVVLARDGRQGVELARRGAHDLVLLDIQLPVMDGYEVARAIRRDPDLDAVPIIAVTSHAMVGDRHLALEAGCTGYFEKPINPDTFMGEIEQVLESASEGGS